MSELKVRELQSHGHNEPEYILLKPKKKYWIIKGSSLIRQISSKCLSYKCRNAKNLHPMISYLPLLRTDGMRPLFINTGIDMFGPMLIKCRRARIKR